MSQFEGNSVRVRCVDCTRLSVGNICSSKGSKVAPKKKRICNSYSFAGEYVNRIPAAAIYTPPVDQSTAQLIKKLAKMGVVPINESTPGGDGYTLQKVLPMPASTATAAQVGEVPVEERNLSTGGGDEPNPGDLAG